MEYDDPVRQTSNLSEKQKQKYTILTRIETTEKAEKPGTPGKVKLDQVPEPRLTLFRREQVEIGYRTSQGGPGSGMFNMGNTCYLNSTLQVSPGSSDLSSINLSSAGLVPHSGSGQLPPVRSSRELLQQ